MVLQEDSATGMTVVAVNVSLGASGVYEVNLRTEDGSLSGFPADVDVLAGPLHPPAFRVHGAHSPMRHTMVAGESLQNLLSSADSSNKSP
jgi:hypothetical protein